MAELFANNGDPDQMQRSAASDLGLHCLPITRSPDYNGLKYSIRNLMASNDAEGEFNETKSQT